MFDLSMLRSEMFDLSMWIIIYPHVYPTHSFFYIVVGAFVWKIADNSFLDLHECL